LLVKYGGSFFGTTKNLPSLFYNEAEGLKSHVLAKTFILGNSLFVRVKVSRTAYSMSREKLKREQGVLPCS
jgi:hypothetical protein